MDTHAARALTSQLADDLGWLEGHCRQNPEQGLAAAQLRLGAALVRNCIGPMLDGEQPAPLHVVVVGGAGAGKSTVANLLSGAQAAEANPQAGFTRHPIAYTSTNGPLNWAGHLGFLGSLRRLLQDTPSSLDEDVYQVRRVPADPTSFDLLRDYVVWDCPDMTTWAATGYVPRLIEAAALADMIVYVASDERYNDEVPTQFLRLLLQTGKPVVVCLMKMRETDAPALVAHFQKEVLGSMPAGVVGILAIPYLNPEQLQDPARLATRYRIPLLNQVAVLGHPPAAARQRSLRGALRFLVQNQDRLLAAAKQDVQALQTWRAVVQNGQIEFDNRYRREYLDSERFRGFDEALVRLMALLDLPGIGKVLSGTLYVLRTPYRMLKGLLGKAVSRPPMAVRPELPVMEEALTGWLDLLRKEAARHADSHPLWAHVAQGFQTGGLAELARDRFQQAFRGFQMALADEVDRTARAIFEELEKNPAKLNALRGLKFSLDAGAIGLTIATGGLNWHDLILVPLAASLTHQLVELLGRGFVDSQREQTRQRQFALMTQYVSGPLADWLGKWPATGGSQFERLELALRRIPLAVKQLDEMVKQFERGEAAPLAGARV
jgi:hypothetical protein